jgi:hypothetical protein
MGMRDKPMGDLQHFSGREAAQVPHIEEKGAPFKEEGYEEGRVLKRTIDESGMESRPH